MKKQLKIRDVMLGLLAIAGVGAGAPLAHATLMLELSDGINVVTVTDGDANDLNSILGAVTYMGSIGNFSSNVSTGLSKPVIGGTSTASIDLNSIDVSGGGPGVLTIRLTDTNFSGYPTGGGKATSLVGGVTDGSVSFKSYLDNSNTPFGTATLLSDYSSGTGAFSDSQSLAVDTADPFSLTVVATITHTAKKQATSFNQSLQVPEPGTIALLGIGLAGIGFVRRLKSQA